MGRLGNFFFEYAAAAAYAMRHGLEVSVPNSTNDNFWNPLYLQHLVHRGYNSMLPSVILKEPSFHYVPIGFDEIWRNHNIILDGYYQSWKYFDDFKEKILDSFGYTWVLEKDFVACHVRRGDYVELRHKHPDVTPQWYEYAMSHFPNKKFLFLSDDIGWCKANFGHRSDCFFSEGKGIEGDLVAGSCCESAIISSSSYGFWMAMLNRNPDKKVYLPKLWFTEGWDGANTNDICPPEWNKI